MPRPRERQGVSHRQDLPSRIPSSFPVRRPVRPPPETSMTVQAASQQEPLQVEV